MKEKTKMVKESITQSEYLQLLGLKVLANKHGNALTEIAEAIMQITGEEKEMGHSGEFVYDDSMSVKELLERLKITVQSQEQSE